MEIGEYSPAGLENPALHPRLHGGSQTTNVTLHATQFDQAMSMLPKVLMVDDENLMGLLYQKHLENAGYGLLIAHTAEEGLALTHNEKPAVIVLDVILPETDGLAALRKLKADEQTRSIPVIVITAATRQEHYATLREAMNCGAAAFLTKPFGPDKLISEIKRLAPMVN